MQYRVSLESVSGVEPPLEVLVEAMNIAEAASVAEEIYPGFEAYDVEEDE